MSHAKTYAERRNAARRAAERRERADTARTPRPYRRESKARQVRRAYLEASS